MIDHLHIKNFLAFPELDVPELKLINLVAGKNTAGKTSLLQAISIVYNNEKLKTVLEIKERRKIHYGGIVNRYNRDPNLKDIASQLNEFIIGLESSDKYLVAYVKGKEILNYQPEPFLLKKALSISSASDYKDLSTIWSTITLTKKEVEAIDIVNESMSIVIDRISIVNDEIKVLLSGDDSPVRIETLGDGVKRVLLYALNLVSAKDSLLLIDEIETHLHHSVIRKLWKIIFEYAIKWNIQVVATTHSQDAIREMFYEAAANEKYQQVSQVLRLQIGRDGKHEVIQYPYEDLEFMMSTNLEIRGN